MYTQSVGLAADKHAGDIASKDNKDGRLGPSRSLEKAGFWRKCGFLALCLNVLFLIVIGQPSFAQFSTTEIQLHYGAGFKFGRNANPPAFDNTTRRQILTIEHFSTNETGDFFFFVDLFHDSDALPGDPGRSNRHYGEAYYHLHGNQLGLDFAHSGLIKSLDFGLGLNHGRDFAVALAGPRLSFNALGFRTLSLGAYGYSNFEDPRDRDLDTTYQFTLIWDVPFEIGRQKFQFKGFTDFIGSQGNGFAEQVVFSPQLRWDVGHAIGRTENKVHLGLEYTHFENKFGNRNVDEDALSVFLGLRF